MFLSKIWFLSKNYASLNNSQSFLDNQVLEKLNATRRLLKTFKISWLIIDEKFLKKVRYSLLKLSAYKINTFF